MQRLFTIFPGSWPGLGLLILRLAAAIAVGSRWFPQMQSTSNGVRLLAYAAAADAGSLLLGVLTPIGAAVQVALELIDVVGTGTMTALQLAQAAVGLSLLMLGPGAWSLDAIFFGRRRIDVEPAPPSD